MNYGLYLSAAGAMTSMHRQDVMANNLANVNTIGFRPDELTLRSRLPERIESNALIDPQTMLEQLGGGTFAESSYVANRQGMLTATRNDLDVAIDGDGYLVVSNGRRSGDHIRLTRDGRLTRNEQGDLVMSATGMKVLDVNDRPIRLNATGPIQIDEQGVLTQNNQAVAKIQIAQISDRTQLMKEGNNLLKADASSKRKPAAGAVVRQGHVESSGVDPIIAMNKMISASKAVAANATMMQYHDHILGQAVNTFGRVA